LVQRLMECAASGDEASDGSLAHLAQLESALRAMPAKWKSALSVAEWGRHAANAELQAMRQSGFRQGFLSQAPEQRHLLHFYEAYHLFHNMVTRIIFGNHDRGGFLELPALRVAALEVGEKVLVDIAHQKVDKHSHMATHYFLTHRGLHAQLREAGHEQGAVLLEVLGRASIAWLRPRQT